MTAPPIPTARSGSHDPTTVFQRTVAEAVRLAKVGVQNDPATIAGATTFTHTGASAVSRLITARLNDTIDAADFGVVGDSGTDDTVAVQAALNAGAAQNKVVNFNAMCCRISSALTMTGPGIMFDRVSHGDEALPTPGFFLTGTGYTAMTVSGRPNVFCAAFFGSGNTMNGVAFGGPNLADANVALGRIQNVRVYNLDGFGVQLNKTYDSVFETISVEQCGNASLFAFSINDAG